MMWWQLHFMSQLQKLNNLFYDVVKDWIKAGVLIEVSKNRGRVSKAQKLHKASKANWIEPESGNILDLPGGNRISKPIQK